MSRGMNPAFEELMSMKGEWGWTPRIMRAQSTKREKPCSNLGTLMRELRQGPPVALLPSEFQLTNFQNFFPVLSPVCLPFFFCHQFSNGDFHSSFFFTSPSLKTWELWLKKKNGLLMFFLSLCLPQANGRLAKCVYLCAWHCLLSTAVSNL